MAPPYKNGRPDAVFTSTWPPAGDSPRRYLGEVPSRADGDFLLSRTSYALRCAESPRTRPGERSIIIKSTLLPWGPTGTLESPPSDPPVKGNNLISYLPGATPLIS